MGNLRQLWKAVSQSGITREMPYPLQKRIELSNHFSIIIFLVNISFLIYFSTQPNFNPVTNIIFTIVSGSIYLLNKNGLIHITRIIISICPSIAVLIVNISLKQNNPEQIEVVHFISPRIVMLCTMALPLTLFTFNEKPYLFLGLTFPLTIGIFYEQINAFFGVDAEKFGIAGSYIPTVTEDVVLILVILSGAFYFLLNLDKKYQSINNELLKEAEEKNKSLNANEEELKNSLEEIQKARVDDEKRSWISSGLAEFATILREEENDDNFYNKVLSKLINYLKTNQGGIYIANKEDAINVQLELKACYAYGRQKYINQVVEPEEGLVGQCYQEGETVYLTEVPDDYITITSGLGEATPGYIFIQPLVVNDNIEGVLELAGFDPLDEFEREFLNKLGESLASKISNQRMNLRTQKLLEQTQVMAENMKQQEVEMRSNFEELAKTVEESKARERDYLEQIKALEVKLSRVKQNQVEKSGKG